MRTSWVLLSTGFVLPLSLAGAQSRPSVIPPKLISMPAPNCKAGKSCHGNHGEVRLIVEILEDGKVGDVKAELGDVKLVDAAIEAASQAEFSPGTVLGKPMNMNFVLNLNF
jgi:Gram-negative bacterial TonB protein C-terminal